MAEDIARVTFARAVFSRHPIRGLAEYSQAHPRLARAARVLTPVVTAGASALLYHEGTAAPVFSHLVETALAGGLGGLVISNGVAIRVALSRAVSSLAGHQIENSRLAAQVDELSEKFDAAKREVLALQATHPDFVRARRASIELLRGEKKDIEARLASNTAQQEARGITTGEKVRLVKARRGIELDLARANEKIAEEESALVTLTPLTRVRVLGEGGMGAVYLYYSEGLGRNVVVKRVRADAAIEGGRPALLKRLEAEALNQAAISHRNVGRLYALMEVEGEPSLIQEYIDGKSLEDIILSSRQKRPDAPAKTALYGEEQQQASERLGMDFILKIALDTAEGLRAAHGMRIVHRDLKPSNILVTLEQGEQVAKIIDFGISKDTGAQAGPGLTQARTVLGTPEYMSPEQMEGLAKVGPPADVYALGIIIYEMIAGGAPFIEEADEMPSPVSRFNFFHQRKSEWTDPEIPGLPKKHPLRALFAQMVSPRPEDRPDIEVVISMLKKIIG